MQNTIQARAAENPVLEPIAQAFLDALAANGGPQIHELSLEDAREVLTSAQSGKIARPPADIEDRSIPVGPASIVSIRIVRPKDSTGMLPVVMYFHGGGWVLGDKDTHDRLIREIATGAGAAVVFVNYSRSPEAHYPIALEEAYAATKWVADNGVSLNLDRSRLAIAGDSAGGNMCAAVTMLAKQRSGPRIRFQVLFYPVTDPKFDTPSYEQFAEGYFLTREAMKWFWNNYAPEVAERNQLTVSPLRASVDQLRGAPPALVITAECDVLRDEGEAYARKLKEAGVTVTATRYPGIIHDFVMLDALADTAAARGAMSQANAALREIFAK